MCVSINKCMLIIQERLYSSYMRAWNPDPHPHLSLGEGVSLPLELVRKQEHSPSSRGAEQGWGVQLERAGRANTSQKPVWVRRLREGWKHLRCGMTVGPSARGHPGQACCPNTITDRAVSSNSQECPRHVTNLVATWLTRFAEEAGRSYKASELIRFVFWKDNSGGHEDSL